MPLPCADVVPALTSVGVGGVAVVAAEGIVGVVADGVVGTIAEGIVVDIAEGIVVDIANVSLVGVASGSVELTGADGASDVPSERWRPLSSSPRAACGKGAGGVVCVPCTSV